MKSLLLLSLKNTNKQTNRILSGDRGNQARSGSFAGFQKQANNVVTGLPEPTIGAGLKGGASQAWLVQVERKVRSHDPKF